MLYSKFILSLKLPLSSPSALLLLIFSFGLIGCASSDFDRYEYFLADGAASGEAMKTIVVLPMNFDSSPPDYMVEGIETLEVLMRQKLEASGRTVIRPSLKESTRLWTNVVKRNMEASSIKPEDLTAEFLQACREDMVVELMNEHDADGVLKSSVVMRPGKSGRSSAYWDGVKREFQMDVSGEQHVDMLHMTGMSSGTSLRVTIYGADGKRIFQNFGGLELTHRYEVRDMRYYSIQRDDLFMDATILEDGLRVAFEPYITLGI